MGQTHPGNIWQLITYASQFLNKCEQRYSTNERELLSVVMELEHFKHYAMRTEIRLLTDNRSLLTELKEKRGHKTY